MSITISRRARASERERERERETDSAKDRQEHGFELDAVFEPHVVAWLKNTEDRDVVEWVSRAVGMDKVGSLCVVSGQRGQDP